MSDVPPHDLSFFHFLALPPAFPRCSLPLQVIFQSSIAVQILRRSLEEVHTPRDPDRGGILLSPTTIQIPEPSARGNFLPGVSFYVPVPTSHQRLQLLET